MDKYIGTLLDNRYEIEELIGTGGMANVYKANDTRLCRKVAIKILKSEFARDPEFKRRFKNESNAVARLSHKNIVNVFDISTSNDIDYIVMELIEGITLKEYLGKKGSLDWKQTLFFSQQIAEGLEHAHSRGIIHQDIKPHNIMLLRDGTLKVADFGIAKLENDGETKVIKEAIGSVHYISPEQAKGSTIDSRTDIYSLGVVMYEMITGRTPFKGDTAISIVMQHLNSLPAPVSAVTDNEIPKGLEYIIEKAMCPSLKRRYKDTSEMISDIEKMKSNPNIIFEGNFEDTSELDKTMAINLSQVNEKLDENNFERMKTPEKPVKKSRKQEIYDEYEEFGLSKPRKGIFFAIFVILIIVAASATFAFKEVFMAEEEPPRIAPDLMNQAYEDVIKNINFNDYDIEIADEVFNDAPAGTIIEQQPLKNEIMALNNTVYVTVSKGQKIITIPDITGYEQAQVGIEFRRNGIEYQEIFEYSKTIKQGLVIRTEPEIGTEIAENDFVTVYLSAGAEVEIVKVPSLDGLTVDQAKAKLAELGLVLGEVGTTISESPEGTIISQDIKKDTETVSGTVINVFIAEKEEIIIPEVTKDLTIYLPQGLTEPFVLMEVYADNDLLYSSTHASTDNFFMLPISGTDSKTIYVYADGLLVDEYVVRFN